MATTKKAYTAVKIEYVGQGIDSLSMTANKDFVIEGTNGASVSISKGEKFTAVRAQSLGTDMWYIVRNVTGEKKCSCPANKPCKHEIHVATGKPLSELQAEVEARAAARKAKKAAKVATPVVEPVAVAPVVEAPKVEPKAIKPDYQSARTLAFFSALPSRQKAIA